MERQAGRRRRWEGQEEALRRMERGKDKDDDKGKGRGRNERWKRRRKS